MNPKMNLSLITFSLIALIVPRIPAMHLQYEFEGESMVYLSVSDNPRGVTHHSFIFNKIFIAETRTQNATHMEFEFKVKDTGYIGFGIESLNTPKVRDCVIAGVDDITNEPFVYDMYIPDTLILTRDAKVKSDWTITNAVQSGGYTNMTFIRRLKTEDENLNQDIEIKNENYNIRWLIGEGDAIDSGIKNQVGISQPVNFIVDGTGPVNNDNNMSVLLKSSTSVIVSIIAILFFVL